jgi:hypothetical protein
MKLFKLVLVISGILLSIRSIGQDIINTKGGGVMRHVELLSDDGDTLVFMHKDSKKIDYLLKKDVIDYTVSSNKDILTPEYRAKIYNSPYTVNGTDSINKRHFTAGKYLIAASNHFIGFIITPLLTSVVASAILLGNGPILAAVICGVTGTGITISQLVQYIVSVRNAGLELQRLEEFLPK